MKSKSWKFIISATFDRISTNLLCVNAVEAATRGVL